MSDEKDLFILSAFRFFLWYFIDDVNERIIDIVFIKLTKQLFFVFGCLDVEHNESKSSNNNRVSPQQL